MTGSARTNGKERGKKKRSVGRAKKKKGTKGWRVQPPTQTRAINIPIGDKEQDGKEKKKKKKQGPGHLPSYPGPF